MSRPRKHPLRCPSCRMEIKEGDRVVRQGKGFVHLRCTQSRGGDPQLDAAMQEPCEIVCVADAQFPWEVRCERENPRFPNLLIEAFYSIEGANNFARQNGVNVVRVRPEDEIPENNPFCKKEWCSGEIFKDGLCEKHFMQQFFARSHAARKRGRPRKYPVEVATNGCTHHAP